MRYLVKKIKEQSGASIIMGILLVLVCTMVSAVIVAAAGTASRDAKFKREQQQAYLTVSSAADLLINDIGNCTVKTDDDTLIVEGSNSALASFLQEQLNSGEETNPVTFTLNFSDGAKIAPVTVKFKMVNKKINHSITADLSTEYGSGKTKSVFQMSLKMKYKDNHFIVDNISKTPA